MQALLFENPWIVGVTGGIVAAVALFVWIQTSMKGALYTSIGAMVLAFVLVLLNLQVITDREDLERTLHHVASLLRQNKHEEIYAYIHPQAVEGVNRAKNELPRYQFNDARVTRIREIEVNSAATPLTATATFTVVVGGMMQDVRFHVPRLVRVSFIKADGKWKMRDYEHTEPTSGGFPAGDAARHIPGM